MEYRLVESWLNCDKLRWLIVGPLSGAISGIITIIFSMWLAFTLGVDPLFPIKLMSTIVLGPSATELSNESNVLNVATGIFLFEVLFIFLGTIFSRFVLANSLFSLVIMGFVWGVFSWIFIWNLFLQSFVFIFRANIPHIAAFPVCIVYGLSLSVFVFILSRALRFS